MFRLGWISDCHLDRVPPEGIARLAMLTRQTRPSALVVTGDISEARPFPGHLKALAEYLPGLPIYFVLGNHDFYGGFAIETVRATAAAIPKVTYLPAAGPAHVQLGIALVGVDGWGDGRYGEQTKGALLNDALMIHDLRVAGMLGKTRQALNALGKEEGAKLKALIEQALAPDLTKTRPPVTQLVVATHVPPFPEAAWSRGKLMDPEMLPYFSCKGTGDVLRAAATKHPLVQFTVLCGHTHSGGATRLLPNLVLRAGEVRSGHPQPQHPLELTPWPA